LQSVHFRVSKILSMARNAKLFNTTSKNNRCAYLFSSHTHTHTISFNDIIVSLLRITHSQ
jgi:hypothetical protein